MIAADSRSPSCRWCLPLSLTVGLTLALLLRLFVLEPLKDATRVEVFLQAVEPGTAQEAARLFDAAGYGWPPPGAVPPLGLTRLPPDLDRLAVAEKKALFFRILTPLVVAENERIRRQRALLDTLLARTPLRAHTREWRLLGELARSYRVQGEPDDPAVHALLRRRVDVVPLALVLAQAANESAWGGSRFAREGNNLFGQWTWEQGAGLVPLARPAGKRYLVRVFPDLRSAVRAYLHNINTGHAYGALRQRRAALRAEGRPLDPLELAGGLGRYSERGEAYVEDLRRLMRNNGLHTLARPRLALR